MESVKIAVTYFSHSSIRRSVTLRVWSKPKYVPDEYPLTRWTDDMAQIYREVG